MTALYFAYGSNLKEERLRARVGSARRAGTGRVAGLRLVCNKRGADGSAKANLEVAAADGVWGALYALEGDGFARLDAFEAGYERARVPVALASGAVVEAVTYRSSLLAEDALPFDWYRALMVEGARAHRLPAAWLAFLEALPCLAGPATRPRFALTP